MIGLESDSKLIANGTHPRYLVIFLISALFRPKSLGTDTSISNGIFYFLYLTPISGCNVLFSMFTLDGIIRSYVNGTSLFSMIAFGSCFHEFSEIGILKCLQMCQWIILQMLSCVSVYSCSDTNLFTL